MKKSHRIIILVFLLPIFAALLYSVYYQHSRRALMERLAASGVIALLKNDVITRDDLREYFQYPPIEENEILRSLELTPEDVQGLGLHEKDRELLKEPSGQLLLNQVIQHIALIKYLRPHYAENPDPGGDAVISQYRESLMIEKMEEELAKASPRVSQEEMLAYYVDNPDEFFRRGRRFARHFMIKKNEAEIPDASPASRLTPETAAERLKNGEDLGAIITEINGGDPSQDGILGWLPRGALHQKVDDALWALEIGEATGPVFIDATAHFIQLLDVQNEGLIPFDECRSRIQSILMERKKIQHRYAVLGLDPQKYSLTEQNNAPAIQKALLAAAYAHGFNQDPDILKHVEAYGRYHKANWVFLNEMEHRQTLPTAAGGGHSAWVLENKVAGALLNEMGFRLLVALDTPNESEMDQELPSEE
ncbi:MAG: peptidylprolyl isomerase [Candidatus Omnitrophica bacterium]|nr:peptidylprolyl isomerase [Candidatus Omnitrophota bacterium]